MTDGAAGGGDARISTREAAARLGVKPETLYAYVSRGLLGSRRAAGGRGSTFDPAEVAALAARGRAAAGGSGAAQPPAPGSGSGSGSGADGWGRIRTGITRIDPATDSYAFRGVDAVALAEAYAYEEVADWLWTGELRPGVRFTAPPLPLAAARAAAAALPAGSGPVDRMRVAVVAAGAADPLRFDLTREAVLGCARGLIPTLVDALPLAGGADRGDTEPPALPASAAGGPGSAARRGDTAPGALPADDPSDAGGSGSAAQRSDLAPHALPSAGGADRGYSGDTGRVARQPDAPPAGDPSDAGRPGAAAQPGDTAPHALPSGDAGGSGSVAQRSDLAPHTLPPAGSDRPGDRGDARRVARQPDAPPADDPSAAGQPGAVARRGDNAPHALPAAGGAGWGDRGDAGRIGRQPDAPLAGDPVSVARRLWSRLTPREPDPASLRVLDTALALLIDHDLATSTLAVRVAASGRAHPYAAVSAGLGALDGPLHGQASALAHRMLRDVLDQGGAGPVVAARLRAGQRLPGLGHRLYRGEDPRARLLLALLADVPAAADALAAARDTVATAARHRPLYATVDLALAVLSVASGMPAEAGEAVFAVGRTAGWVAHALEEYAEPALRMRPSSTYEGPPPPQPLPRPGTSPA